MPRAAASRAIRVGASAFLEQGVEKSVVIVLCVALHWQELTVGGSQRRWPVETRARCIGMPRSESAHLFGVLGAKHRARRVKQSAASREHRPQGFEQALLLQDEAR
jgi:hypothetical protein